MEMISTIASIMATSLYVWNPDEKSLAEIQAEAREKKYDTIPIRRDGEIEGLLYVDTGKENPISQDLLLTRDTPISDALKLLAASEKPSLLVLYKQHIVGIITPSDFNKITARSYFYNLLAYLEIKLATEARKFYTTENKKLDEDRLVVHLIPEPEEGKKKKTVPQYRRKIKERASGAERKRYDLDLVHLLLLSEFEQLICSDGIFRDNLGFESITQFEQLFDGINNFRHKVMHSTRLLLSDESGIEQLDNIIHRILKIIEIIESENNE